MSDAQLTTNRNRALMGLVALLALVAAVLTISGAGSSSTTRTSPIAVSPESALPGLDPAPPSGTAVSSGGGDSSQPTPSPAPAPNDNGSSNDNGGPATPAGATTPTIGPITLTSSDAETVIPDLRVSVVNGNGTVTTFIDTGVGTATTLVPGSPLTLSQGAASGIDPADINRIEVEFLEHNSGRELFMGAEDNGTYTVEVEKNGQTGGNWVLKFDVDGLV